MLLPTAMTAKTKEIRPGLYESEFSSVQQKQESRVTDQLPRVHNPILHLVLNFVAIIIDLTAVAVNMILSIYPILPPKGELTVTEEMRG